ncbi:MAG TPA: hypothetical protein PLS53_00705 [Thermoanaerobaculaceae bacterium]|nr:hypothetical protein [Thermoanaerobaculaceae bacterium]HPS76655.1 hypothetical protein [Thermoanaerobaculaceae bacterium]
MDWKEQINKATAALRGVTESETVKNLTAKAKQTASDLARAAKQGAASAADAVVSATSDPATVKLHYLGTEISVVSPSDGLQITRPHAGALVISDQAGNGLVISLAPPKAQVSETVGVVKRLNDTTFDLGTEDGVNVIVLKA